MPLRLASLARWLEPPGPARRLAWVRVTTLGFAGAWLAAVSPELLATADFPPHRFAPVGVAAWMSAPAPPALLVGILSLAGLTWWLALTGRGYRGSAPAFAAVLLWLLSYRNSWGHLSHSENLLVLHVCIVSLAPAAIPRRPWCAEADAPPDDPRYGWPLRLMMLVTVSTYLLAGIAKLSRGGGAWLTGEVVQLHVAHQALRSTLAGAEGGPLGAWLLPHAWAFGLLALTTVGLELGSVLALIPGRLRWAWLLGLWSMHAGIWAVMGIGFAYPLSGAAFAAFLPLERLRWGGRPGSTAIRR